jgi:hypothetical protein
MACAIAVFASGPAHATLMPLAIVEDQTTVVAHWD